MSNTMLLMSGCCVLVASGMIMPITKPMAPPKQNNWFEDIGPIAPRPEHEFRAQHDLSHGNIVMSWTPRAASTFALEVWFRFLGCAEEAAEYAEAHGGLLHSYESHIRRNPNGGKASQDDLRGKHNFKFKFVMNPFHRAVTMFSHAMRVPIMELHRIPSSNNLTFIEFLHYLHRDNAHGGFYDNDNNWRFHSHYAPQVALKCNDASLYDVICKLEDDIADCLSQVNSQTGANFSLPNQTTIVTSHQHVHQHLEGDVANIPYTKFEFLPISSDFYAGESGQRAAKIVQMLYKCDFEAYGYIKEHADEATRINANWYRTAD